MFISSFEDLQAAVVRASESEELNILPVYGDISIKVCCPHCGESYYMENYSTCTAAYYPPIYKDGVNINPDRNTTTTYCTCMNCGKEFSYKS